VAQAAHAAGCAMGVVPQGTFNYFARTHGLPLVSIADLIEYRTLHDLPANELVGANPHV